MAIRMCCRPQLAEWLQRRHQIFAAVFVIVFYPNRGESCRLLRVSLLGDAMPEKILVSQNQSQVEMRSRTMVVDSGLDPQAIEASFQSRLHEHGYGEAELRTQAHNFALDYAFGYAEHKAKEPVFHLEWKKADGEIFVAGHSLLGLVKPSDRQLSSYQEKGIQYVPLPEQVVQDLLAARQELLSGKPFAAVLTIGCDRRNYLQVFLPDSSCHLIEHIGDPSELRAFHDRVMEALETAYQRHQTKLLNWGEVLTAARDSLNGLPSAAQREWLDRLKQHCLDPEGRRKLILHVAEQIEKIVLERLLPLLKSGELDDRLEGELLGLRPKIEKLLSDELQNRLLHPAVEKPAATVEPSGVTPATAPHYNVEPTTLAAWHAVETDRKVRTAARGVHAQLTARPDLERHGLREKLEAMLKNGVSSAVFTNPISDPILIAETCRTVAAFTNDPDLSSDLYVLAETLEQAAKRAWRAVREGEISVPRRVEGAALPRGVALSRQTTVEAFSPELQELLNAMAQEEEKRKITRRKLKLAEAVQATLGRPSRNPFLAALRQSLAVPEDLLEILTHPSLRNEFDALLAQTTGFLAKKDPKLGARPAPLETEEESAEVGLKRERDRLVHYLEGLLKDRENELSRAKRKWEVLQDTEVYDIGLIIELVEILNLPTEERTAILNAAGIGQPQVTLVERIAKQLIIERKFRVIDGRQTVGLAA